MLNVQFMLQQTCNSFRTTSSLIQHQNLGVAYKWTLDTLLKNYFTEDVTCFCSTCNMNTTATKRGTITKYPKVLCLIIGRKTNNDRFLKSAVEYPVQEFKPYFKDGSSKTYSLITTINYRGNNSSGHYTSICFNTTTNAWINYNDDKRTYPKFVTNNDTSVINFQKDAAMLFYLSNTNETVVSNDPVQSETQRANPSIADDAKEASDESNLFQLDDCNDEDSVCPSEYGDGASNLVKQIIEGTNEALAMETFVDAGVDTHIRSESQPDNEEKSYISNDKSSLFSPDNCNDEESVCPSENEASSKTNLIRQDIQGRNETLAEQMSKVADVDPHVQIKLQRDIASSANNSNDDSEVVIINHAAEQTSEVADVNPHVQIELQRDIASRANNSDDDSDEEPERDIASMANNSDEDSDGSEVVYIPLPLNPVCAWAFGNGNANY
jgi:hypothetical protein